MYVQYVAMESINCFVIELYQFRKLAQKEIFVPNGIESENEGRKEVRTLEHLVTMAVQSIKSFKI